MRTLVGRRIKSRAVSGPVLFYPPPDRSGWSWVNQGTASIVHDSDNEIRLTCPIKASAELTAYVRTYPTPPFTLTALVHGVAGAASGGYGLILVSATTQLSFMRAQSGGVILENWTNPTTFAANPGSSALRTHPVLMQVEDNNTNLIWRFAWVDTPTTFTTLATVSRTSFLTGGPVSIGLGVRDNGAAVTGALLSWLVS